VYLVSMLDQLLLEHSLIENVVYSRLASVLNIRSY
jgi:hypothetical protein